MFFYLFLFGLFFIIFLYFLRAFVVIPAKHFSVLEQFGQFYSVLLPGTHLIYWPFQQLKLFTLSEIQQNGSKKVFQSTEIAMTGNQMDFPPIKCVSKDKIQLEVDLNCYYNVCEFKKFAYENSDPGNFLYQNVIQQVKIICYKYLAQDVQVGNYTDITDELTDELNKKIACVGLTCTQILIQSINVNKIISDKEEAIFASKRQLEMLEQQEKSAYHRELQKLENEKKITELKNKMLLEQQQTELQLKLNSARSEKERRDILGETPEYLLQKEWYASVGKCFEKSNRVVLAPFEYFSNPSRLMMEPSELGKMKKK
jgi:regulator of protease activity HflC (stomatin/prohibitin superfamily)